LPKSGLRALAFICWGVVKWQDTGFWFLHSEVRILPPQPIIEQEWRSESDYEKVNFCIFAGNSNPDLADNIGEYLDMPLCGAVVKRFSDGEIQIEINENVRTKDVFVLQSTCDPVNDNLVELLLMVDALKRASARRITAVIPTTAMPDRTKRWRRGCPSAPSWSPIC
jgi:hypothetical protein